MSFKAFFFFNPVLQALSFKRKNLVHKHFFYNILFYITMLLLLSLHLFLFFLPFDVFLFFYYFKNFFWI